jgi:hypothetical protein
MASEIDPAARVGHVNLKVSDLERSIAFYGSCRRPSCAEGDTVAGGRIRGDLASSSRFLPLSPADFRVQGEQRSVRLGLGLFSQALQEGRRGQAVHPTMASLSFPPTGHSSWGRSQ